jgi:transposase
MSTDHAPHLQAAIQVDLGAIYVSLELSRRTWLVTSLSPGSGEKMSVHSVPAGDVGALLMRLSSLKAKAGAPSGREAPVVVIMEAGYDGFWIHRVLEAEEIESYVVDAGSIPVPRRARRAKTDRIDGVTLLRTLMAFKRGEPRVCSMTRPPTPEDEDRRRICRERKTLLAERVAHTNRIKGLLFAQGIGDYEPERGDRRRRLEELVTGDGRKIPEHLKRQILRELDRLELVIKQIKAVEAERDALLVKPDAAGARLLTLRGVGQETAGLIAAELLWRSFDNRRQLAAYAGIAATPWRSGSIDHEQGISKSGNPRLRTTLVELAWRWLRHQPKSELSCWFHARVGLRRGSVRRVMIVALARKLLIALWRFETQGVIPAGAVFKPL